MKIHHIGYYADDINCATEAFETLGFNKLGKIVEDVAREAYIQFLANGGSMIELVSPVSKSSPIYSLRKKYGNSPYHICYETNNIQAEIDNMTSLENTGGGGVYTHTAARAGTGHTRMQKCSISNE